jgi:hypothetical protein
MKWVQQQHQGIWACRMCVVVNGGWLPPSPNLVKCRLRQHSANPLVRGSLPSQPGPSSQTKLHHLAHQVAPVGGTVPAGAVQCPPGRGHRVGSVAPNPGDGEGGGAGPGSGPGVGVSPQPRLRAGPQDRPLPVPVDPLVEACSRACLACNLRLPIDPVPFICHCCRAWYHKLPKCLGLTSGALDVWKRSKH